MAKPHARPARSLFKLFLWLLLTLAVAAAVAGYLQWQAYLQFADSPLAIGEREKLVEVKRGDSFRDVLRHLRSSGIREGHDLQWKLLAFQMEVLTRLQVGEYALGHGLTPRTLLLKLAEGKVIQHRFTIIEGWNVRDLRRALVTNEDLVQTLEGVSDDEMMRRLAREGVHPEGRFLPETYQFTRGVTDIELLRRAMIALDRTLEDVWAKRDSDLPLRSAEELLVLASIVEKETGRADERPTIAGVFVRRLNLGMKLQTDPTVIYGLGEGFDGNLTRRHLTTDTLWNTYTRTGLPPTPIAMAGRAALEAAANPLDGDALYFVSKGDGSHQFSRTLSEHNAAVRRYQLGQR